MKRSLIIEDDRRIARALTRRVKSAGYEATAALDGLTGLNAAIQNVLNPAGLARSAA